VSVLLHAIQFVSHDTRAVDAIFMLPNARRSEILSEYHRNALKKNITEKGSPASLLLAPRVRNKRCFGGAPLPPLSLSLSFFLFLPFGEIGEFSKKSGRLHRADNRRLAMHAKISSRLSRRSSERWEGRSGRSGRREGREKIRKGVASTRPALRGRL